jgi:hypothetical protein
MTERERDIERALVGMVKRHGGLCLKWVCPGWSGVPDRIILLPGGRVLFVETKRPKGGEVAKLQEWWGRKIKDLGFQHLIIKNKMQITELELYIENAGRRSS